MIAGYSGLRPDVNAAPLQLFVSKADSRVRAATPSRAPL
jgi:hypothetical protein